jgi:probable rRNA maturation factor
MPPEGQRGRRLHVRVADGGGRPVSARGLSGWLARVAPARARGEVGVAIVSDARIRALNKRYRRRDYATDVLSFPAFARGDSRRVLSLESSPSPEARIPGPYLGDIVIARGVARRQARAAGHSEFTEWRVLALHGLLHLLGYDHERDRGAMARLERRLRRSGGLGGSLMERHSETVRATGSASPGAKTRDVGRP